MRARAGQNTRVDPASSPPARRRWLLGIIVAWAGVLIVLAFVATDRAPTVKEQVNAGVSRDAMAQGTALALGSLSGVEGVVVTATGFEFAERCKVTPVREGVRYTQSVRVYTSPANVASVMDRLYGVLRKDYDLVTNGAGGYTGQAQPFITALLVPTLDAPLVWRLDTGCRPDDDPTVMIEEPASPGPDASALVSGPWHAATVDCGDGRKSRVNTATGAGTVPDPAWKQYAGESGGSAWVAGAASGTTVTVTSEGDGEVTVREMTACARN